jgi:glycosyltransferase involved in cell wall biosynthesis
MVTCICPTGNRQHLIPLAIRSFLNQTHTDSELLIVDSGYIHTVPPENPRIRYMHLPLNRVYVTGVKRNICCENARGEIIVHWDDDDWSHPERVARQVARLAETGKQVTGYHSISYHDIDKKRAFEMMIGDPLMGTSQCYYKAYWEKNRFLPQKYKEDVHFADRALGQGVADHTEGIGIVVVRRHKKNTWGAGQKIDNGPAAFRDIEVSQLPPEYLRDVAECQPEL